MAGTDMATRILKLYESLSRGKEIKKASFCVEHGIDKRTFDRDIQKIRLFLSEEYSGREVQYRPDRECYRISDSWENGEVSFLELAIIIKILKGEQALERHEFEGLVNSLKSVVEKGKREEAQELARCEIGQYENPGWGAFLKLFGDLLKCISDRNIIWLEMKNPGNEKKRIKFFPVAVEFQGGRFYLLGYQTQEEGRLAAFLLDEIESFRVDFQKYKEEMAQGYTYREGKRLLENYRGQAEAKHF